ncbi:hypothetical protein H9P43_006924 [Blastocladiella emersonii ATCC 22665]|nr:hypothetical protein H9P43_006924 [Blastocladiella emersonii ATCC 22665]
MFCGRVPPGKHATADLVAFAVEQLRQLSPMPHDLEWDDWLKWARLVGLARSDLPVARPVRTPDVPVAFTNNARDNQMRFRRNHIPLRPLPGPNARFFDFAQLLVEARAALAAGITLVFVPGGMNPENPGLASAALSAPHLDYGAKVQAVQDVLRGSNGERTVVWCQSPVLAALISRAIATTTDLPFIDSFPPILAVAERAMTEFNEGMHPEPRAIILPLPDDVRAAVSARLFPNRLNMLFVHPVVGSSESETLQLVYRALRIAKDDNVAVRWLVAKGTVEESLIRPIVAKFRFGLPE